ALGRTLLPQDERDRAAVGVLSDACWQRRYAHDPGILGRSLTVNGVAVTVVGVAAPDFFGLQPGSAADLWMPLHLQSDLRYNQNSSSSGANLEDPWMPQENVHWLSLVARVPPASAPETMARLSSIYRQQPQEPGEDLRLAFRP